jgi:hypothetical protein
MAKKDKKPKDALGTAPSLRRNDRLKTLRIDPAAVTRLPCSHDISWHAYRGVAFTHAPCISIPGCFTTTDAHVVYEFGDVIHFIDSRNPVVCVGVGCGAYFDDPTGHFLLGLAHPFCTNGSKGKVYSTDSFMQIEIEDVLGTSVMSTEVQSEFSDWIMAFYGPTFAKVSCFEPTCAAGNEKVGLSCMHQWMRLEVSEIVGIAGWHSSRLLQQYYEKRNSKTGTTFNQSAELRLLLKANIDQMEKYVSPWENEARAIYHNMWVLPIGRRVLRQKTFGQPTKWSKLKKVVDQKRAILAEQLAKVHCDLGDLSTPEGLDAAYQKMLLCKSNVATDAEKATKVIIQLRVNYV